MWYVMVLNVASTTAAVQTAGLAIYHVAALHTLRLALHTPQCDRLILAVSRGADA